MNAHVVSGVNGLPKVVLQHGSGSRAEVYLNGAHVIVDSGWWPRDDFLERAG
jgi:hypothetical protein